MYPTLFKGENGVFISGSVTRGRAASIVLFLYVLLSHMILLWLSGHFVPPWETGVYKNVPYQNKMQKYYDSLTLTKAWKPQHANPSKSILHWSYLWPVIDWLINEFSGFTGVPHLPIQTALAPLLSLNISVWGCNHFLQLSSPLLWPLPAGNFRRCCISVIPICWMSRNHRCEKLSFMAFQRCHIWYRSPLTTSFWWLGEYSGKALQWACSFLMFFQPLSQGRS